MNILFTICARAGSKGVKGKNTKEFCGYPLLAYTVAAYELFCQKYGQTDCIYLALNTDSELLLQQMETPGTDYIYVKREEELAGDVVSKKDVIQNTLIRCEEKVKLCFDVVVDLDLTSPLRRADDIRGTIDTLLSDKNADISYSVTGARRSPYFNMVSKEENGYYSTVIATQFATRQQTPVCYDMNASIYAYTREYLLSDRIYERKALIWEMPDTGILDIDSEEDLELMEVIGRYFFENKREYQDIFRYVQETQK